MGMEPIVLEVFGDSDEELTCLLCGRERTCELTVRVPLDGSTVFAGLHQSCYDAVQRRAKLRPPSPGASGVR